jgi:hypothetical protein
VDEILANEEEWLIEFLRQVVGEAIAEVEPRGMAAALAELAIGFASEANLLERDRLNTEAKPRNESIKLCNEHWIWVSIDNDSSFKKRRSGDAS